MATVRPETTVRSTKTSAAGARVLFVGDDHALLAAFKRGDRGAAAALFDRYAELVGRTIARILGTSSDLSDVVQEAFVRMLRSAHLVRDPQALPEWVIRVAVCTAADELRARKRRRWLLLEPPSDAEPVGTSADVEGREAVRATYAVLDELSVEERTAFTLRFIDGMDLQRVAASCDCSLATIKRRLERAEARFRALARRHAVLAGWLSQGGARAEEGP